MNLKDVLSRDMCCILQETMKSEVLFTLTTMIKQKLNLTKEYEEALVKNIFYREQLMSTGIGLGIGIPHIRFEGVSSPILAVGISKKGITDYASIDDEVIKFVVMIIVGKNQHKQHIRLLSIIVALLKQEETRERLIRGEKSSEIYAILTGDDNYGE
jgi:nitrogen PTS system EIIA component